MYDSFQYLRTHRIKNNNGMVLHKLKHILRDNGHPIDFSFGGYDCQCNNCEQHLSQSILMAVWRCDLDELTKLMSTHVPFDINYRGKPFHSYRKPLRNNRSISHGYTPLQVAVYKNFTSGMKLLIEHKADVNSVVPIGYSAYAGQSPLSIALSHNMKKYRTNETVEQVRLLLNAGAIAQGLLPHNKVDDTPNHETYMKLAILLQKHRRVHTDF
jgi:hypothetical protein